MMPLSEMDRLHPTGVIRFIIVALGAVCMLSFTDGQSTLRLQGYKGRCAGRVELLNGTRVCSDSWSLSKANALCQQLSCGKAVGAGKSTFGNTPLRSCNSRRAAGVVCAGGMPKPMVSTQPPTEVNWHGSISISCSIPDQIHSLIQGTFIIIKMSVVQETKLKKLSFNSFILPLVTFEDEGQYECCYDPTIVSKLCKPVPFTVTVDLQAPNISVSSPDGQQMAGDRVQVTRGYRFVIVCSTSDDNPEGQFFLQFSGRVVDIKPAVNHSASFHFPQCKYEDQGEYSCVHQVTGAGRNYTSLPSAGVQVTVRQPLVLVILPVAAVGLLLLLVVLIGVYFCHKRRRRSVTVTELVAAAPSPSPMTPKEHQEDDEEEEEEADYVNVPPPAGHAVEESQCDPSDDEADYENVIPSHNDDTLDIYGGDDSIYQNYEGSYRDDFQLHNQKHAQ